MLRTNSILIIIAGFTFLAATCRGQKKKEPNNQVITKIEFTSGTRGYQKEMYFTPDSLISMINNRGENKITKRRLAEEEWQSLIQALSNVDVKTIGELPSPSSKRE